MDEKNLNLTNDILEDVIVKEETIETFEDEAFEAVKREAKPSAAVVKHEFATGKVVRPEKTVLEMKKSEFKCQVCLKSFKKPALLKYHMVSHSEGSRIECKICGKKLKTAKTYKNHMQAHKEVLDFPCEYCEMRFAERSRLNKHLLSHTKPYRCEICDGRFAQKTQLTTHMEKHAGKQCDCTVCGMRSDSETVHECVGSLKWPHRYDKCRKKFMTLSNLTQHQLTHEKKKFRCEFCETPFYERSHVIAHIKERHRDVVVKPVNPGFDDGVKKERKKKLHICTVCKWNFSKKSTLGAHKCKGFRERPHQCDTCQKKFLSRRNLNSHLNLGYCAKLEFKCEFCEKPFSSTRATRLHIIKQHKDVDINTVVTEPLNASVDDGVEKKLMKQELEDYAAVDESITVVKHEVDDYSSETVEVLRPENTVLNSTHFGIKNFECEFCNRTFNVKSALKQHINKNHKNVDINTVSSSPFKEKNDETYET